MFGKRDSLGNDVWCSTRARLLRLVLLLGALAMAQGCGGAPTVTAFPTGLVEREATEAEWPAAGEDGALPERLELVMGEGEDRLWAHGRAYVHAPIEDVAAALQDIDVIVGRRSVDEWSVEPDVEVDYPVSFRVHAIVHHLITVDYDVTWRQAPRERDGSMVSYLSNYQKTAGTQYIELMQGSILATQVEKGVTRLEFVSELRAMRTAPKDVALYIEDTYACVVAHVHGEPLPSWEE